MIHKRLPIFALSSLPCTGKSRRIYPKKIKPILYCTDNCLAANDFFLFSMVSASAVIALETISANLESPILAANRWAKSLMSAASLVNHLPCLVWCSRLSIAIFNVCWSGCTKPYPRHS